MDIEARLTSVVLRKYLQAQIMFSFYAEHKYSNLPDRLIIVIFSI